MLSLAYYFLEVGIEADAQCLYLGTGKRWPGSLWGLQGKPQGPEAPSNPPALTREDLSLQMGRLRLTETSHGDIKNAEAAWLVWLSG